jgi:hypothetical protein
MLGESSQQPIGQTTWLEVKATTVNLVSVFMASG